MEFLPPQQSSQTTGHLQNVPYLRFIVSGLFWQNEGKPYDMRQVAFSAVADGKRSKNVVQLILVSITQTQRATEYILDSS